ncbi:MAG: PocR ligand-binding domain-containing protein [Acutalibacteraceae bacterium]|nr:PocR ligand-binding domain-containing protein [Acutalibacteraceae bacterium]
MQNIIEIKSILKDFYSVSGIRISIHDTEFNEIYSYPAEATPFCKALQKNSAVLADCKKNDSSAFGIVKKTGEVYVYKCRRGLFEAVAPVYHYGTLSGYLMMGQICDGSPESMDNVIEKASAILGNRQKAEELSKSVKSIDRKLIDSYINIMTVLAGYLTGTNRLITHNEKLPQLIKEYINKNFSAKITLSILSQKFGCCNATLTKTFKKEYNLSIMEYLCDVRLEKSKEMIVKTRKSFKEIAADCGFYDQNYFSKIFAKKYGSSPTEYRKMNIN